MGKGRGKGRGRGRGKGGMRMGKEIKGAGALTSPLANVRTDMPARLSYEENERLAQLANLKRIQLKKLQQQEELNTRINKMKIMNLLRRDLRKEKLDQLLRQVEIVAQDHEYEATRKDRIIKQLCDDLDDMEEQIQVAQRSGLEKLDKLAELHHMRLHQLHSELQRDIKTLKVEFDTERQRIVEQHHTDTTQLRDVIQQVEEQERKKLLEAQERHETDREEINNKNKREKKFLKMSLKKDIKVLQDKFNEEHRTYLIDTNEANTMYKKGMEESQKKHKEIHRQEIKIEKLQAKLASWKQALRQNEKECTQRNSSLKQQKMTIVNHYQELKGMMKKFRQMQNKRLTELTTLSRHAQQSIESKKADAERILKLAELARKFETEREKVQPFYESSVPDEELARQLEEQKKIDEEEQKQSMSSLESSATQRWEALDNFYKRYNKVLLDKLAVAEEKKRLQAENEDLKTILKQIVDGVGVTGDALDHANPLVIVNGRVNPIVSDPKVKRGPPGVIVEANTVVRKMQLQGGGAQRRF